MYETIKIIILAIYCISAAAALVCMAISVITSDIQFRKDRKKLKEDREKSLEIMEQSNKAFQESLKEMTNNRKFKIEK